MNNEKKVNKLRWFGVLPQTVIQYGKDTRIDLSSDSAFDEVVLSIMEELKTFHPSVKKEHRLNGDSFGHVREAKVLTLAEAHKKGFLRQRSARMLYLGAEPLQLGDLERAEFASVGLYTNVLDEHNKTWKWWLGELSITDSPHIRHEQTPASELNAIQFTSKTIQLKLSTENIFMENTIAPEASPEAPSELDALRAELIAVKAERDALKAELEKLKEAALEGDAEAAIEELELSAHLRPAFKAMYIRDKASFDLAAAGLKEARDPRLAPKTHNYKVELSSRKTSKQTSREHLSDKEIFRLASQFRSEQRVLGNNLTHGQAIAAVRR